MVRWQDNFWAIVDRGHAMEHLCPSVKNSRFEKKVFTFKEQHGRDVRVSTFITYRDHAGVDNDNVDVLISQPCDYCVLSTREYSRSHNRCADFFFAFPPFCFLQDMERERLRGEAGDAMEDVEEEDTVPEILPRHFEDAVRNARRSVSDRDLAQYSSFAQNLQQVNETNKMSNYDRETESWFELSRIALPRDIVFGSPYGEHAFPKVC